MIIKSKYHSLEANLYPFTAPKMDPD